MIPIRRAGVTMQVADTGRVKDRLIVRVLVHGPGGAAPLPMRVLLPARCVTPIVGRLVVFGGLRLELRESKGQMRSLVRADRVQEVACHAAA